MNIEEATKILKKAKEPYYTEVVGSKWIKGYTTVLGTEVDKAIDIVLNELDKKDKVIDMMAEQIRASDIDEDICKLITEPTECVSRDCKCENCIKEYFYNKVEIPEKN